MRARSFAVVAAILSSLLIGVAQNASPRDGKKELIRGRVVAHVASLAFGAGVGPKWTSFIVSVEQPDGRKLVRIAYAFNVSSQLPSESFMNYSNLYEMKVKRDETCDTTAQEISYEENVDTEGNKLPSSFILVFSKNSPIQALDPALKLPCYVLYYYDYKQVNAESKG